jgi:hypothetical protein
LICEEYENNHEFLVYKQEQMRECKTEPNSQCLMASSVSKDEQEFDMVRVVLQQIYDSLK